MLEALLYGGEEYKIQAPNNPVHPCWYGTEADSKRAFRNAENKIREFARYIKQSLFTIEDKYQRSTLGKITEFNFNRYSHCEIFQLN